MQKLEFRLALLMQDELQERGISVTFSRLPAAYVPPIAPETLNRLQASLPNLIAPERGLLVELSDNGYADDDHMNERGRTLYTRWLVNQMMQGAD